MMGFLKEIGQTLIETPLEKLTKDIEVLPTNILNTPIDFLNKSKDIVNFSNKEKDVTEVKIENKQYENSENIEKWKSNPENENKLIYVDSHSAEVLRKNLVAVIGENPDNSAAHHIVGNETEIAAQKLEDFGINRNDPENGIFLPLSEKSELKGSIHDGRHCKEYTKEVDQRFYNVSSEEECREVLDSLKEDLLAGILNVNKDNRYNA
ncbi:MAG: AHH domain-containing protein [Bacteroidales bacterium]|nr:AHH domain-containing protein [Bacteroidales bacterium]